jgi:hypothetical protein
MITFEQWKYEITAAHGVGTIFTYEDGSGISYGEPGDWTAHTGPDMQADVVGVFSPENDYCNFGEYDGLISACPEPEGYGFGILTEDQCNEVARNVRLNLDGMVLGESDEQRIARILREYREKYDKDNHVS